MKEIKLIIDKLVSAVCSYHEADEEFCQNLLKDGDNCVKAIEQYTKDKESVAYTHGLLSNEAHQQDIIKARIDLEKQIEAYKEVCEKYIPTNKLDEANSEVILICKGTEESMGRDLLRHKE